MATRPRTHNPHTHLTRAPRNRPVAKAPRKRNAQRTHARLSRDAKDTSPSRSRARAHGALARAASRDRTPGGGAAQAKPTHTAQSIAQHPAPSTQHNPASWCPLVTSSIYHGSARSGVASTATMTAMGFCPDRRRRPRRSSAAATAASVAAPPAANASAWVTI